MSRSSGRSSVWPVGRFLQNEPLLGTRASSHYLYASQNPLTFVDPLGLQDQSCNKKKCDDLAKRLQDAAFDWEQRHGTCLSPDRVDVLKAVIKACEAGNPEPAQRALDKLVNPGTPSIRAGDLSPIDPSKPILAGLTMDQYQNLPYNEWMNWWFSPVGSDRYVAAHGHPRQDYMREFLSTHQGAATTAYVIATAPIAAVLGGQLIGMGTAALETVSGFIPSVSAFRWVYAGPGLGGLVFSVGGKRIFGIDFHVWGKMRHWWETLHFHLRDKMHYPWQWLRQGWDWYRRCGGDKPWTQSHPGHFKK